MPASKQAIWRSFEKLMQELRAKDPEAYRREMAQDCHPDRFGGSWVANEVMKEVNAEVDAAKKRGKR